MHINNNQNISLLDLLLKNNTKRCSTGTKSKKVSKMDSFEISSEAQNMIKTNAVFGKSVNTRVDESIDLQGYVDRAREANQAAIANAGNEIKSNNFGDFEHTHAAFTKALTEKYTKLFNEAKSHSDPEDYIRQKYTNGTCSWYAGDLTEQERQIGFRYELQMLTMGKIMNVEYKDSLFRGIDVMGSAVDSARDSFNRQMVNAQIGNILEANGINLSEEQECTFEVDPYSYRISVNGVDDELKAKMEIALNVGENGKNLYYHIRHCARQDGANSTQITKDGNLKYQAYQHVLDLTGIELSGLEERDGSFYTEDGRNIIDIVKTTVGNPDEAFVTHNRHMKDWIIDLIKELAAKGWDNIKDMKLSIDYSRGGLSDKYQDISYNTGSQFLNDVLSDKRYVTM